MIKFSQEKLSDLLGSDNLYDLLFDHWEEVAVHKEGIPFDPDIEKYKEMERIGVLHVITARDGKKLVGYSIYIVSPHIHYMSSVFAVNDVVYLSPEYRRGFTGIKLLKFAEESLKKEDVDVIHMHVKNRVNFGGVLSRMGYQSIEEIYSKYIGE